MKNSRLKMAVKNAIKIYYKSGFTNTAFSVLTSINEAIEKAYSEKHKRK